LIQGGLLEKAWDEVAFVLKNAFYMQNR
jgi:hypothetical protein